MASAVSLYTLGPMFRAVCLSATSEAVGFPKENLMDFNPDTYWKATSAALQQIVIDLGSAKNITALVVWVNNYSGNQTTTTYELFSSPDNAVYTSRGTGNFGELASQPIIIKDISVQTFRYWRFDFDASATAGQISGIWWCQKFTISQGNEWPENDLQIYHNRSFMSYGGRSIVQAINSNKVEQFGRTYQLDDAKMTVLKNAFIDSAGTRLPVILQEGAANADARLVRFGEDSLDENQFEYQLYRPTIRFITMPYIADGANF